MVMKHVVVKMTKIHVLEIAQHKLRKAEVIMM